MDRSIQYIKGVGAVRAAAFAKLGIKTLEDLLYFFPRTYEDRSEMKTIDSCLINETVCVRVTVSSAVRETRIRRNMVIYTAYVSDDTGMIQAVWYNNKYIKNVFVPGAKFVLYGKIGSARGKLQIENPIYERAGEHKYTGKIVPIYPLTGGLVQKNIQSAMAETLVEVGEIEECLPQEILSEYKLRDINYCMKNIHFPESRDAYNSARRRFVFEELLALQLALFYQKHRNVKNSGYVFDNFSGGEELKKNIPYKLTKAQKRVIADIVGDFKSGRQMNRLIQGDVGSGKTIVAACAAFIAAKNGYQSIMMAPTEILASQHAEELKKTFSGLGVNVVLLVGSMSQKEKSFVRDQVQSGLADVVVGTHAVIQDSVIYNNLGLVIADEQHRFGVNQRAKLCAKGNNPHMLVMSATPIPRTLALILYGDLDISVIDELPPGRKPVKTYAVGESMRKRVYKFIGKSVEEGRQAYVVCPLIEETEGADLQNTRERFEELKRLFPDFEIGIMHGRMKGSEKEAVMERFLSGEVSILVCTTVIEVGVNVPNAGIMVIENAERFGLSQLHQLRGRVGRGCDQAYCILFCLGGGEITKKRMETMCSSNDGFYISEQDLSLRGPGDFFGTRQHGLPDMKIANLFSDTDILKLAQTAARHISDNGLLDTPEYAPLKKRVEKVINRAEILN